VVDECPAYNQNRRAELFRHYDGVIARASPQLQRRLRQRGVPLVNTWYQHARRGLPGVYQDAHRMGELTAEHLIERGFRRLSMLFSDDRRAAVDAALAAQRHCEAVGVDCVLRTRRGQAYTLHFGGCGTLPLGPGLQAVDLVLSCPFIFAHLPADVGHRRAADASVVHAHGPATLAREPAWQLDGHGFRQAGPPTVLLQIGHLDAAMPCHTRVHRVQLDGCRRQNEISVLDSAGAKLFQAFLCLFHGSPVANRVPAGLTPRGYY
jgi:hypothetical protein